MTFWWSAGNGRMGYKDGYGRHASIPRYHTKHQVNFIGRSISGTPILNVLRFF